MSAMPESRPSTHLRLVQIPEPYPGTYMRCVAVNPYKSSNLFSVDYSCTVYEVEAPTGMLLPLGSLALVVAFQYNLVNSMPTITLTSFDVPCYGHTGTVVTWMRAMTWSGIVTGFWLPTPVAQEMPTWPQQFVYGGLSPSAWMEQALRLSHSNVHVGQVPQDSNVHVTTATAAAQGASTATAAAAAAPAATDAEDDTSNTYRI